jgi:predicted lipid carrier protein YhbT
MTEQEKREISIGLYMRNIVDDFEFQTREGMRIFYGDFNRAVEIVKRKVSDEIILGYILREGSGDFSSVFCDREIVVFPPQIVLFGIADGIIETCNYVLQWHFPSFVQKNTCFERLMNVLGIWLSFFEFVENRFSKYGVLDAYGKQCFAKKIDALKFVAKNISMNRVAPS